MPPPVAIQPAMGGSFRAPVVAPGGSFKAAPMMQPMQGGSLKAPIPPVAIPGGSFHTSPQGYLVMPSQVPFASGVTQVESSTFKHGNGGIAAGRGSTDLRELQEQREVYIAVQLLAGDVVEATETFKSNDEPAVKISKGMCGTIMEIDKDGDARIDFRDLPEELWVFSSSFKNLRVVEACKKAKQSEVAPVRQQSVVAPQGTTPVYNVPTLAMTATRVQAPPLGTTTPVLPKELKVNGAAPYVNGAVPTKVNGSGKNKYGCGTATAKKTGRDAPTATKKSKYGCA
jgi:hypothetical protein